MAFIAASFLQAFCAALLFRPVSTTAADSAIRCRCGMAFQSAPCHRLSKRHCASESFSSFHIIHFPSYTLSSFHLPKVRRFPRFRLSFRKCAEAAQLRERPVSTFLLSPYPSHLPRCAFSCVFRTPSEGGKIQHRPEIRLSLHFSVHRTCSTFQRCRPKRIFPSPSRFRYKQLRHRSTSSWPCRKCRQEGAGRNGILPPPSEIRYMPTCLRVLSRRPCFGFPSRRCRRKLLFTVTFPPPSRHSFYTPSKGVALSHHFSTPSEGVRGPYSVLFQPSECLEQFPLHLHLLTPSKGVVLSHHFSTPSEGVRGLYSALFLPSECLEQFPLHLHLFTPSKGVALSHHFPTPSKGVNPRYRLTSISYLVPAKSCDPAQSML